jgi:hypothetical protein
MKAGAIRQFIAAGALQAAALADVFPVMTGKAVHT